MDFKYVTRFLESLSQRGIVGCDLAVALGYVSAPKTTGYYSWDPTDPSPENPWTLFTLSTKRPLRKNMRPARSK